MFDSFEDSPVMGAFEMPLLESHGRDLWEGAVVEMNTTGVASLWCVVRSTSRVRRTESLLLMREVAGVKEYQMIHDHITYWYVVE
jgi:hypothetical protein